MLDVNTHVPSRCPFDHPARHGDDRGFSAKAGNRARMVEAGAFTLDFVQTKPFLIGPERHIRGLHFQSDPHAQDKLVRCGAAACSMWPSISVQLATYAGGSAKPSQLRERRQLLVPRGFFCNGLSRSSPTPRSSINTRLLRARV